MNLMANQFLDKVSLTEQSSGSVVNIVDQDEFDPLEETTMLMWDPDLPMPSDDIFEVQEPPAEVLVVKTQSKGQLVSNDLTIDKKGKPFVPPFILMFEVFNPNLHNVLVDSCTSSNVDAIVYLQEIKCILLKSDKHIIQLDKT
jgi:hypothetical protein